MQQLMAAASKNWSPAQHLLRGFVGLNDAVVGIGNEQSLYQRVERSLPL